MENREKVEVRGDQLGTLEGLQIKVCGDRIIHFSQDINALIPKTYVYFTLQG